MDEYISREMAVKKLQMQLLNLEADQDKGEYSELCENRGARDALDEAIYDIRTIKAADVQPVKHGKWIEQRHTPTNGYNYNVPYSTYVCSSCGLEIHNDEYSKYVRGTYTNCPVCTARMDGDAE